MNTIKTVVCGEFNCGKSCLMLRMTEDVFGITSPTVGVEFHAVSGLSTPQNQVTVWNLAGSRRFQEILNLYYKGAQVVFLVIDSTVETNVGKWIRKIRDLTPDARIVLVFTKIDLPMHYTLHEMEIMKSHYQVYSHVAVSSKEMSRDDILALLRPCFEGIEGKSYLRVSNDEPPPETLLCCAVQ